MANSIVVQTNGALAGTPGLARGKEAAPSSVASARSGPVLPPNPSLRLDATLGLIVIELRDERGVVESLPTARQLKAYLRSQEIASGPGSEIENRTAAEVSAQPHRGGRV